MYCDAGVAYRSGKTGKSMIAGTDFGSVLTSDVLDNALNFYFKDRLNNLSVLSETPEICKGYKGRGFYEVRLKSEDAKDNYHTLWQYTSWDIPHANFVRFFVIFELFKDCLAADRRIYWDALISSAKEQFDRIAHRYCARYELYSEDFSIF